MPRTQRISAFAHWLDTLPPGASWHEQENVHFFADLTDGEMFAALQARQRRDMHAEAER